MKLIVLGAGVIGVTCAWYLARRGHEVTVIDRQPGVARETSFANGGQVSSTLAEPWARPSVLLKVLRWLRQPDAPMRFRPRADPAQWRWAAGFLRECVPGRFERNARSLAGLARYSRDCLRGLREELQLDCGQTTRGVLQVCFDDGQFASYARAARLAIRSGAEIEIKSREDILALEPALAGSQDAVSGGLYAPDDESGDAYRFTCALAERAERAGVAFRFGARATRFEHQGERLSGLWLADGERLTADAFVVCAGSESPRLIAPLGLRIPVYPLKGYSITLRLSDDEIARAPTISLTDESRKIVVSRFGDRLRAAGTAELAGYDASIDARRCDLILERVRSLFPGLGAGAEVERWAGLRPATPGNVPIVGCTRFANLFLNTGHGTLGWTLACGSGRVLADIVSGRLPQVRFAFQQ